jgi:hypothetical protein
MRKRGERVGVLGALGSEGLVTEACATLPDSGARRLMLAVLSDALGCLATTSHVRPRKPVVLKDHVRGRKGQPGTIAQKLADLRAETLAWFQSDEDHPYTFVGICQATGLDPTAIREELQRRAWRGVARMHRSALLHTRETPSTR